MLDESEIETVSEQYRCENIDGKNVIKNIGKNISWYKIGSEYASGGAGCISTTLDYIKFLEGLRTYKLLKPETLKLMITERLNEEQNSTFWTKETHGYGLGVRCPKNESALYSDFGWGGAAGAYLAVDLENEISLYFASHLLMSPVQGIRSMLYRIFMAEYKGDDNAFENIKTELIKLHNYNLTY
jgi:CubicO group peptidase (beta-lactamase class C family)